MFFSVYREKDQLWKKTDKLEFEQKVKAAGKWMEDKESTQCLGCHTEFSFIVRKVTVYAKKDKFKLVQLLKIVFQVF